jgi:hypothetical protein
MELSAEGIVVLNSFGEQVITIVLNVTGVVSYALAH